MSTTTVILPAFRFLDTELENLKAEKNRLEKELALHEVKIAEVCSRIELKLLRLIPDTAEYRTLRKILNIPIKESENTAVSFLRKLLNESFDQKEVKFLMQHDWHWPISMSPFSFEALEGAFSQLTDLWKDEARITVLQSGIYLSFTFHRLS